MAHPAGAEAFDDARVLTSSPAPSTRRRIANTIGKISPAPKVSVISCCEELMKPNSAPNTQRAAEHVADHAGQAQ